MNETDTATPLPTDDSPEVFTTIADPTPMPTAAQDLTTLDATTGDIVTVLLLILGVLGTLFGFQLAKAISWWKW